VRHRERERVGCVAGRELVEREDDADHLRDLALVGAAVGGHRSLHAGGSVLEDVEACACTHEKRDATRVAELRGGLRIFVKEERLHAGLLWLVLADDLVELTLELDQAPC
jgi:hypothetical protein